MTFVRVTASGIVYQKPGFPVQFYIIVTGKILFQDILGFGCHFCRLSVLLNLVNLP